MKALRKTIRRIIFEMQDPYKEYASWEETFERQTKLMNLIKTGDPESVNQALELSEALEYIGGYVYSPRAEDGYSGKKTYHGYELYAPFDEDFLNLLRRTHKFGDQSFELTEPDDEVIVLMFVEKIK